MNAGSSRSHSILTVIVETEEKDPADPAKSKFRVGKLNLVDLAGRYVQQGMKQELMGEVILFLSFFFTPKLRCACHTLANGKRKPRLLERDWKKGLKLICHSTRWVTSSRRSSMPRKAISRIVILNWPAYCKVLDGYCQVFPLRLRSHHHLANYRRLSRWQHEDHHVCQLRSCRWQLWRNRWHIAVCQPCQEYQKQGYIILYVDMCMRGIP